MIAVSSSAFLKEFTIYADKAHAEKEAIFVQRSNDKNLVVLPMEMYNDLQKQIYELKAKLNVK